MKFIKKYLVLAVVTVLFGGAFVLNLIANGEVTAETNTYAETGYTGTDIGEYAEADDYFESFRQDREEVRQLEMEYLDEVIAASASDQETMEKEFAIESMIKAKGFEDAAVTFHSGTVNVVVKSDELEDSRVAQILDIVQAQTGEPAKNIKVMAGQ